MKRYFLCLDVPLPVKKALLSVQEKIPFEKRLVPWEQLHITLLFFGYLSPDNLLNVHKKLNALSYERHIIELARIGCFNSRIIYAGIKSKGVVVLQKKLSAVMNIKAKTTPHITIARLKQDLLRAEVNDFIHRTAIPSLSWRADKIIFKQSTLTPNGAIHKTIREYLFRQQQPA